jgi:SAM-dependent methyltransferase
MIKEIKGLKYPDDYIIRFLFKEKLHEKTGKMLELGCGNGNNLMPFFQYGWDVSGVDTCKDAILNADENFFLCQTSCKLTNIFNFYTQNMVDFINEFNEEPFDVLLLPNSICYLDYPQIIRLFFLAKKKKIVQPGSYIFIRTRTPSDCRYGMGERIGDKTFKLKTHETGEYDLINTFLNESELISILELHFEFEFKKIFHVQFDNIQMDYLTTNHDIVFWGKINTIKV